MTHIKNNPNRFLSILLTLCIMLTLLLVFTAPAYAATATEVEVGGEILNTGNPSHTSGTATFNAATGVLSLNVYNGGAIIVKDATSVDLTIDLTGINKVSKTDTGADIIGINNPTGGNIIITSLTGGSLEIDVKMPTGPNHAYGIYSANSAWTSGGVTIEENAEVTITPLMNGNINYAASGICTLNINILDDASLDVTVDSSGYGYGLQAFGGDIVIDTNGDVTLDASNSNSARPGRALDTDNDFYLYKAGVVTLINPVGRTSTTPSNTYTYIFVYDYDSTTDTEKYTYIVTPISSGGGGGSGTGSAKIIQSTSTPPVNDTPPITPTPVTISVSNVTLDKTNATLKAGEILQLIAAITPNDATNKGLNWSSSNPSVATVDSNGRVTGLKDGTVTITVTTSDGSFVASCEVTISGSVADTKTSIPGFAILTAMMGLLCAAVLFKWQMKKK